MHARTASATAPQRFSSALLGIFAVVALTLAAIGIYGVITVLVVQRTHEIGVRMAVGASSGAIMTMIVGQCLRLALAGMAVGLAAAVLFTRLMQTLLFGVTTTDLSTYVAITLVLGIAAALASWIPARRAARLDPLETLRSE